MSDESATCGGAVAGSIMGTIICIALLAFGAWWLYRRYWRSKSGNQLVVEDGENVKVDYAFDNPAFKGDNIKNVSPFDNKWKTPDKRKTVDDSFANTPIPRLVPLRGSDFTGLGIEVCGGLKEGIFIKKVMPQGPAVNLVNRGDKITSITIDFRHIVQEDAATILSYASPYNVQLELIEGKGTLPKSMAQQISQQTLVHPLYRSSSQADLSTIERNARRKLFSGDENSYPTLKMDQQQQYQAQPKVRPPSAQLPQAHEEHEKKNSLKKLQHFIDLVEEKFQTKSSQSPDNAKRTQANASPQNDAKKGMKFGIRVLPPNVNDKEFGKSPSKVQADNENNANMERMEMGDNDVAMSDTQTPPPPEATKRSKNKIGEATRTESNVGFERQTSINSSGIKRDADGIPQEMPSEMMQAALTARDNRKGMTSNHEKAMKSKGKAPRPPSAIDYDANEHSETIDIAVGVDATDSNFKRTMHGKLNFSDNFDDEALNQNDDSILEYEHLGETAVVSSASAEKERKKNVSDLDHDSDAELNSKGTTHIELNAKHITVHQTPEEDADNEGRRTASLGDLSKLEFSACPNGNNRPNAGTLERAQSLEISDQTNAAVGTKVMPKKRKAALANELLEVDFKEPRLSEPIISENLEAMQAGRLKSAYEWGNLEDAIYDCKEKDGKASDDADSIGNGTPKKKLSSTSIDMMTEVLAAADKFDREVIDIELKDVLTDGDVIDSNGDEVRDKPAIAERSSVTWYRKQPTVAPDMKIIDETRRFIETEARNVIVFGEEPSVVASNDPEVTQNRSAIAGSIETDRVKVINPGGTSLSDDVELTSYPFGSLERPKSEVLKKLIAQRSPLSAMSTTTTTTTIISNGAPLSVETVESAAPSAHTESSEPVQISPVFSSDGHGVNSISISSNDSVTVDNVITITTDDPQPSSIIQIDDENINFTLRTLDGEKQEHLNGTRTQAASITPPLPPPRTIKDEVFIIESLSSKKIQDASTPPAINKDSDDETDAVEAAPLNFVTEIRLSNVAGKDQKMNAKNLSKSLSESHLMAAKILNAATATNNSGDPHAATIKAHTVTSTTMNSSNHGNNIDKPVIVEQEYIPRNAEIKFTTSTYQSPARQFDKRHSHIDQIRSTFERQHTSEIPVPIRKLSTPSTPPPPSSITRTSPSKIPVLHSQKSSDNLLKMNNGPMANRSVSVTSIKNSSRNPSGK